MTIETIAGSDTGTILGNALWAALADEYLNGPEVDQEGWVNATLLALYINSEVRTHPLGLSYEDVLWIPTGDPEPYPDMPAMRRDWVADGIVFVSNQHCDHPVWSVATNVAFRVWHDTGHIKEGLGFSVDDELRLFGRQARHLPPQEADALFSESVYQLAACVALGGFPDVQHARSLGPTGRAVRDLLMALS